MSSSALPGTAGALTAGLGAVQLRTRDATLVAVGPERRFASDRDRSLRTLGWCGAAASVGLAVGVLGAAAGAAALLVLVAFATGIGPSEKQALRSRGADDRRSQRATSAFLPWSPKR